MVTTTAQAGMAARLQISEREWKLVAEILAKLAPGLTVWAFGSRATGRRVKPFSDLDLAVPGRLPAGVSAALKDHFDEALIDFKVDLVELGLVDTEFRERVERDFVVLQAGA